MENQINQEPKKEYNPNDIFNKNNNIQLTSNIINNSNIEFPEEGREKQLIKKEDVFLFVVFFAFINVFIYLYLYKTTWSVPHSFKFILLNYPLWFMGWGGFVFFIHPSLVLKI